MSSSKAEPKTPTGASGEQPQRAARQVPAEPYPWKRVLIGSLVVIICWCIGFYREYKDVADQHIKYAQDWTFNQLWTHASGSNVQRLQPYRTSLWEQIHGSVLEIGPGFGESMDLIPNGRVPGSRAVSRFIAVEPNAFFHDKLAHNSQAAGFAVRYDPHTCPQAEEFNAAAGNSKLPVLTIVNGTLDNSLSIPEAVLNNAPYDFIASSMVLCSVNSIEDNVQTIFNLLAPGGKFVFIEHVRHTDEADHSCPGYERGSLDLRLWKMVQSVVTPVWSLFTGNCHLNRDTAKIIEGIEGWKKVEYKTVRQMEGVLSKLTPIVCGVAIKE
ncbi:hypothetical protein GGF37_003531 [Kickxella alabastrina]|nr:hypothetical protein GGF37_003531 [Kickxella alabastrina]